MTKGTAKASMAEIMAKLQGKEINVTQATRELLSLFDKVYEQPIDNSLEAAIDEMYKDKN